VPSAAWADLVAAENTRSRKCGPGSLEGERGAFACLSVDLTHGSGEHAAGLLTYRKLATALGRNVAELVREDAESREEWSPRGD